MNKRSALYQLPFGDGMAVRHATPRCYGDQIDAIFPGLNEYEALEGLSDGFFAKSITLGFPSITIVASVLSASRVDRGGRQHLSLMLPLVGQCDVSVGAKKIHWGAGHAGVLLPEYDGRIIGSGEDRSMILFRLNPKVLAHTAQAMLGESTTPFRLNLEEARPVPLELYGGYVDKILWQIGGLMDLMGCELEVLYRQGYEDLFNRLVVRLLHPEFFMESLSVRREKQSVRNQVIDRLCDDMVSNLSRKTTLTELERKSGYSARALQYAFKEKFGCSPLEWLREQRLLEIRQRLLKDDNSTIVQLADLSGFGTSSQLCVAYKRRFGETPSETRNGRFQKT